MIIRTRQCKAARIPRAPHAQLGWLMQDTVVGNPQWMDPGTDHLGQCVSNIQTNLHFKILFLPFTNCVIWESLLNLSVP